MCLSHPAVGFSLIAITMYAQTLFLNQGFHRVMRFTNRLVAVDGSKAKSFACRSTSLVFLAKISPSPDTKITLGTGCYISFDSLFGG